MPAHNALARIGPAVTLPGREPRDIDFCGADKSATQLRGTTMLGKMKRLLLLSLIVTFAGCASIATRERADIHRQLDARFDFSAVSLFLRQLVRTHPSIDGLSIEKTQIGDVWLIDESWLPVGLTSGDWTFQQSVGSDSGFELSYRADTQTVVVFHCERIARGQFRVVSFGKEQLVTLTDCRIKT